MIRTLFTTVAALAITAAIPASAETVAITHAHIYSMGPAGEIASGTIILKDGKIAAIGADVATPFGARVIDAQGKIVTPGLVITSSNIGASEIGGVENTNDSGVSGGSLSAGFDVQYSLNPDSTLLPIERLTGTTSAIVTPELRERRRAHGDKLFSGQAAAITLAGGRDMLLKSKIAVAREGGERGAAQAGGARGAFVVQLAAALEEARSYRKNRSAYDQNRVHPFDLGRADLEALGPVVEGHAPLLIDVHRASDIRQIIAFAREQKIHVILSGVEEGWRVASELAAAKVPVVLDADEDLPSAFESLSSTLENAARLNAAGVSVSIHGPELTTGGKAVRLAAGRAVSRGLPWGVALASITLNPAKAFGLAAKIGSIEPGKRADVVIWNGDPLDTQGAPERVLIGGVEQSLRSRQLDLRDRYLKPDDGLPPQYH